MGFSVDGFKKCLENLKVFFRLHEAGGPMGPQIYDLYVLYTQKYVVFLEQFDSGTDLGEFYS